MIGKETVEKLKQREKMAKKGQKNSKGKQISIFTEKFFLISYFYFKFMTNIDPKQYRKIENMVHMITQCPKMKNMKIKHH